MLFFSIHATQPKNIKIYKEKKVIFKMDKDSISGNHYDILDCINQGELDHILGHNIRGRIPAEGRKVPARVIPDEIESPYEPVLRVE